METKGRMWMTRLLVPLLAVACATISEKETREHETETWVAKRTSAEGLYRVGAVFDALERVDVEVDSHWRAIDESEWRYDAESGLLSLTEPPGPEAHVRVHGVRAFPWSWRAHEDWDPSTLRVLHGRRELARGTDYAIEESERIVRFSPELCTDDARYFVVYSLLRDPAHPGRTTAVSFGNHDADAVRRFLGVSEDTAETPDSEMRVATNAMPTDDPAVFTITRAMRSASLRAGFAKRDAVGDVRWLEPAEFEYEPDAGRLTLLGDRRPGADEHMFVSGVLLRSSVLNMHGAFDPATVRVVVGENRLEPGIGFRADGEAGTITILDPGFLEQGVQFYATAGSIAVGNYRNSQVLTRLLRE